MSTYIALEDGRILGASNGLFDAILECAARQLESRCDAVDGFRDWLLDQRCEVQGPGIGHLDLRDLSPRARSQFRAACMAAYDVMKAEEPPVRWLDQLGLLIRMWASIDKGEPPEALTCSHWRIFPHDGDRRGPGWE